MITSSRLRRNCSLKNDWDISPASKPFHSHYELPSAMSENAQEYVFEIDCPSVKTLLDDGEEILLLDVRTPAELDIASLSGATLIPMQEIETRISELDGQRDRRMIVFCHHGGRSERVALWLRQLGFAGVQNMTGGIDAWAVQVDTAMPRY